MARTISIALIPGDGIGPEVVAEATKALAAAAPDDVTFELTEYPFGAGHYLATGNILDDDDLAALAKHDAIILGAVGGDPRDPKLAGGIIERGLLLRLRFAFDQYVNLRPTQLFPNVESPLANPGTVDFVVVREGTEGPYVGNGGVIRRGTEFEIATEVSINTAHGVERLVRFGFETAARRRKKLTLVHKTNVLTFAGDLWQRTFDAVAADFPQVATAYNHVDAACIYFVQDPQRYDVIVTDNLFGDIITDLAGAVSGGVGFAGTGNLNPDRTSPSMFEPVHGSAHDIVGTDKVNPSSQILSAAMLVEFLGEAEAGARIRKALDDVLAGNPTPVTIGDLVAERV
jgi:3-isopropylmalate dehydrogenase